MAEAFKPEEFGTYRLTHLLGKGGMASVFRALREGPHGFSKQVAIKRLHSTLNNNESILKALINEARLGGQLKHPNIVEIYEFNKVRKAGTDAYYLAMEFVDGWTLDRVVKLAEEYVEPLSGEVVLAIVIQICQGLHYAHMLETLDGEEVHLVHRDLKPANIILSRDGVVKIMDFGIAKAATNLYKTTLADTTKGTPHYMSPEQVAGDPNIAATSDIFALGTVIYELVTGKLLFKGDSLVSVLFAVAKAQVDDQMAELDQHVPGLGAVVGRCLAKNPALRYPTAEALNDDLASLKATIGGNDSIRSYLYALRNHMIARDQGLQEESTVVDQAPEFATLLGPDWGDMAAEEAAAARELDDAQRVADEVIEEVASFRSEPGRSPDASWLETLPADGFEEGGSGKKGAASLSPRRDRRRLSMPGKARPNAETAVNLGRKDPDRTREFKSATPKQRNWLVIVLLLLLPVGVVGILMIGRGGDTPGPAVTPQSTAVAGGEDVTFDLSSDMPTPTPVARRTPRPTPRTTPRANAPPAPTAAPTSTPPPDLVVAADPTAPVEPLDPGTPPPEVTPAAPAPTPEVAVDRTPGKLLVKGGDPALMVYVDGDYAGYTPLMPGMSLDPGRHTVQLKHPESGAFSPKRSVTVQPGKRTVVPYYDFLMKSWK